MTIEQAKSELMQIYGALSPNKQVAIDTLVKIQPCEDAVSKKVVLGLFNKSDDYRWETTLIRRKIEKLPPVTPQPKTGHWVCVEEKSDWYAVTYECSCCGRGIITPHELIDNLYSDYPYCHCGAKMVDKQERSDKNERTNT